MDDEDVDVPTKDEKLYEYSTSNLIKLKHDIEEELRNRSQSQPDDKYLKLASEIKIEPYRYENIELINWTTITQPIKVSYCYKDDYKYIQTIEKISEDEYLIKTTEKGDYCEPTNTRSYYYVSLPILRAFIKRVIDKP